MRPRDGGNFAADRSAHERKLAKRTPEMTAHKYQIGDRVQLVRAFSKMWGGTGEYEIVRQPPQRNGEFEYRIMSITESYQRVVRESELRESPTSDARD
jgi:hypothetical protein